MRFEMHSRHFKRRAAAAALVFALTGTLAFGQAGPVEPGAQATPPAATASALAATAQSDDGKSMVRLAFSRVDANKDGKLTPDEANALPPVAAKFSALDTNHDGVISEDEFVTGVRIGG